MNIQERNFLTKKLCTFAKIIFHSLLIKKIKKQMTNKIFISFFLGIFYCSSLFSQEISRADYEKWVDFVNCKYVKAYFDKKIDDANISKIFRDDYNNRLQKLLLNVSFENADLRIKSVESLKSYQNGKILMDFIESKKADFDKNWDKTHLIEHLLALPTDKPTGANDSFDVFLSEEKANLKSFLQKELLPQIQENTETQIIVPDSAQKDTVVVKPVNTAKNIQKTSLLKDLFNKIPLKWLIIAFCVIILAILFFIFKRKIFDFLSNIKFKTSSDSQNIVDKDLLGKIEQLEKENQALTDKVFLISYKNDELRREIDRVSRERDLAFGKIKELENVKIIPDSLF